MNFIDDAEAVLGELERFYEPLPPAMRGLTAEVAGQAATAHATPSATAQLNAIPYAIVCIDEIGRIVAANATAEEMLGCSLTRLHHRRLPDVLHCEDDRLLHRVIHTEDTLVIHGIAVRPSA